MILHHIVDQNHLQVYFDPQVKLQLSGAQRMELNGITRIIEVWQKDIWTNSM